MAFRVKRSVLGIMLGNPNVSNSRTNDEGSSVYQLAWACGCTAQEHAQRGSTFFLTPCRLHADDFAIAEHDG